MKTTEKLDPSIFPLLCYIVHYTMLRHMISPHFSNHTGVHQSHLHSNLCDGGHSRRDRLHLHSSSQGVPPQRVDHSGPGRHPLWVSRSGEPSPPSYLGSSLHVQNT